MRKYLISALAMGLVLTSCQSDEPFALGSGEEVQASFTISVPDAMGTRAGEVNSAKGGFSNGAGNLNYTVALLNQDNKVMYSETCQSDGKTATFHPTVVQGYTYKVVAYATFGNTVAPSAINEAFDGNDALASIATLKGISDESEDAYYCFDTEVLGGAEMSATLRRPFGKLRLVATDYDKLQALGSDVASVKVTYGENVVMETHFNAMAEVFGGQATSKEFEANKATYAEAANELTVFTDYLPASKTGETMYPFTIVTTYTNGETYTRTFAQDIPVKRNYLTTLRGDFFTTEAALTLKVNEMFETPGEDINFVSVSNASQLQEAIDNAPQGQTTEIVLNNDIDLIQPIVFGAPPVNPAPAPTRSEEATAGNFILDLNGKTIENPNGYVVENYSAELTISGNGSLGGEGLGGIRSHGGKLIIEGGNYTCSSNWSTGTYQHILKAVNTEVTINGGTFDATAGGTNNAMINVSENSVVTINAGTFKNVNGVIPQFAPYMFTYEKNGKLIINGGDFYGGWRFNGETATTDIYGGNFTVSYDGQSFHANSTHVLTIYGGAFSLENGGKLNPANHVTDGYKAIENGGKYYVVPNEFDAVATTTEELAEVLANKNISTIMLGKGTFEIELYRKYPARELLTIIGTEGTKVKFANQQVLMDLFKYFTIKNCEILHMSTKSWGMLVFGGGNKADGVYTVENCLFNGVGTQGIYINENTAGATYNVKNCTFKGDFGNEGAVVIQNNADLNGEGVVNVTVKENTFNNVTAYKISLLNIENGKLNLDTDVADSEIGKFNR